MFSNDDFEKIQWHDNHIHGFRILEGDVYGELIFDIDFIEEWLPPVDNAFRFKVASSDLIYHEVTDLIISINYVAVSAAVQPMSIHEIHRESVNYSDSYTTFNWKIELNWPPNSYFSFVSSGFTQQQRMAPIVSKSQYLLPSERC